MDWDAIGAIGEITGAIAVLVTLVYLAVQIRQNTRIFTQGRSSFDELDDHEKVVFDMLMMRLFAALDTTTFHYEHDSYDDELYAGAIEFYAGFLTSPGGRQWYKQRLASLSKQTRARLEQYLSRGAS